MDRSAQRGTMTAWPEAKNIYLTKGWPGPLPLPARAKKSPPDGFTGKDGRWPNEGDFAVWDEQFANGNTCIRLPDEVVVGGRVSASSVSISTPMAPRRARRPLPRPKSVGNHCHPPPAQPAARTASRGSGCSSFQRASSCAASSSFLIWASATSTSSSTTTAMWWCGRASTPKGGNTGGSTRLPASGRTPHQRPVICPC